MRRDSIVCAVAPYPGCAHKGEVSWEVPPVLCLMKENDLRTVVCHFQESEFLQSLSLCFLFNFKAQKAISHCPHLWELSSEYWTHWKTIKSREGLSGIQLNCRGDTAQILQRNSKGKKTSNASFPLFMLLSFKSSPVIFFLRSGTEDLVPNFPI